MEQCSHDQRPWQTQTIRATPDHTLCHHCYKPMGMTTPTRPTHIHMNTKSAGNRAHVTLMTAYACPAMTQFNDRARSPPSKHARHQGTPQAPSPTINHMLGCTNFEGPCKQTLQHATNCWASHGQHRTHAALMRHLPCPADTRLVASKVTTCRTATQKHAPTQAC